jgi:hypothetical protein
MVVPIAYIFYFFILVLLVMGVITMSVAFATIIYGLAECYKTIYGSYLDEEDDNDNDILQNRDIYPRRFAKIKHVKFHESYTVLDDDPYVYGSITRCNTP